MPHFASDLLDGSIFVYCWTLSGVAIDTAGVLLHIYVLHLLTVTTVHQPDSLYRSVFPELTWPNLAFLQPFICKERFSVRENMVI